jgi:hypothetical protein
LEPDARKHSRGAGDIARDRGFLEAGSHGDLDLD